MSSPNVRSRQLYFFGAFAVVAALGPWAWAETLTFATTYPAPAGVYNYLVTTGNSDPVTPANTVLNRNAGNTILAPSATNLGGMVGIGTTAPTGKLTVNGQMLAVVYNAGGATGFDWNNGNLQYTAASCGAMSFSNMQEGGAYSLVVKGATAGTCTFSQGTPDSPVFRFFPGNAPTTAGAHTVYTFLRAGGIVYVSWIPGF